MTPIDIIISIIERHLREALNERDLVEQCSSEWEYLSGKMNAYEDLIDELVGFKRLFN